MELLQDYLGFTLDDFKNTPPSAEQAPTPLYLKLTVRCLTSCLRLDLGVTRYASTPQNLVDMMSLIKQSHDEELVANGCKCIRISLRDEKVTITNTTTNRTCRRSPYTRTALWSTT